MAAAEASLTGRRQRRRPSAIRRWLPTGLFALLVGGMVFLFAALRILAQTPDPARSATVPEIEVAAPAAEVTAPPVVDSVSPAAPGETVTSLGRIRFSVKQIDPSYTVVQGDSLSSIAQRYGTTAEALQGINNLPNTLLSVGQRLVLP